MKSNPDIRTDKTKKQLGILCRGLTYISEVDSWVEPFFGEPTESNSASDLLTQIGKPQNTYISEHSFDAFFDRLTVPREWHNDNDKKRAQGFRKLRTLLEAETKNLKVFKIGRVQIEIFAVGIDKQKKLLGVTMRAVET